MLTSHEISLIERDGIALGETQEVCDALGIEEIIGVHLAAHQRSLQPLTE